MPKVRIVDGEMFAAALSGVQGRLREAAQAARAHAETQRAMSEQMRRLREGDSPFRDTIPPRPFYDARRDVIDGDYRVISVVRK